MHRFRLPLGLALSLAVALGVLVSSRRVTTAEPAREAQPKPAAPVEKVEPHPLDPLTEEEITAAAEIVRASKEVPATVVFVQIVLHEPPKELVLKHKAGDKFPRRAFAILHDRKAGITYEVIADLDAQSAAVTKLKGVQPTVLFDDYKLSAEIVRKDKRWLEAMRKRGLKDEELLDEKIVGLDSWATGPVAGREGQRLVRVIAYYIGGSSNPYPRVIEGISALVNLGEDKVVDIYDAGVIPIPTESFDYFDPKQIGKLREKLKPLQVSQPKGVDFEVVGHEIRWQKWSMRYSVHPREGLVLHAITYNDGGKPRSILYRASLSEMLVPYADPSGDWRWRNAFDAGEYGMGLGITSLRAGREVPETAALYPVVLSNTQGTPTVLQNGVAIYEQDGGLLWTHADFRSGKVETRRARQLVLQTVCTLGNYDYSFKWIFGQDGAIDVQAELTGVVLVKGIKEKKCIVCQQKPDEDGKIRPLGADRYGEFVAPQIVATHHQHFFNFRLDFDIESTGNTVVESELVAEDAVATNPERNGFLLNQRILRTEREAQRDADSNSHRSWKVINPNRQTALGHFPGYELQPGSTAMPFAHPESTVRKRAVFASHHLWATKFKPTELYAAGDYPNQSTGGDGLPKYCADNESLVNTDVVLWHTMGISHASRAEDWPVMPVSRAGFRLVPHNFFDRNPALDVP